MASSPQSLYKTNLHKFEDAMKNVVRNEVCRVFQWLYQGHPKYVGDYLDEISKGKQKPRKYLNNDEKELLNHREPATKMDISFLYRLLQRTCNLRDANDPAWTDKAGSDCSSLEHTLYLIKEERNKMCHEGHTQEAQQMSDNVLDQKLEYLRELCANLLVEAARRCDRLDKIVDLNDKMETRLQDIRGITSDKFIRMAKEETLNKAPAKMTDAWYQHPFLQRQGQLVTLKDVLQWRTPDGESPAFLLATGEAGMGKSSLSRYLEECWLRPRGDGKDPLQCYQLVLLVHCRDVTTSDVVRHLQEDLLPDTASSCSSDVLSKFLRTISTLWIFDGLDEASGEATRLMSSLLRKHRQNTTVLVTARPECGRDFLNRYSTMTNICVSLCGVDPIETIRNIIQSNDCDQDIAQKNAKSLMEDFKKLDSRVQQELQNPLKLRLTLQGWEDMQTLTHSQVFDLSRLYQKITDTQIQSLIDSLSKDHFKNAETTQKVETWFLFLCESAFGLLLCRRVFNDVLRTKMVRNLKDKCHNLGISSSQCLSTFLSCPTSVFSSGNTGFTFYHDTQVHFLAARYVESILKASSDLHSDILKLFNIASLLEHHSRQPPLEHFLEVLLNLVFLISDSASEAVLKVLIKLLLNAIPLKFFSEMWFLVAKKASYDRRMMREIGRVIPELWYIRDDSVEAARQLLEYSQPKIVKLYIVRNPEELKEFEPLVHHLSTLPVRIGLHLRHHSILDLSGKDTTDKYLKIICREESPCVLDGFEGHLSVEGCGLLKHPKISDYCRFMKVKVKSIECLEAWCEYVRDFEFLEYIEVVIAMKQIPFSTCTKLKTTKICLRLPFMTHETAKDTAKLTSRLCQSYDAIYVYDMTCDGIKIFLQHLEKKGIVVDHLEGCIAEEELRSIFLSFGSLPLKYPLRDFSQEWRSFRTIVCTKRIPFALLAQGRVRFYW